MYIARIKPSKIDKQTFMYLDALSAESVLLALSSKA
jgi:hypothetical protein